MKAKALSLIVLAVLVGCFVFSCSSQNEYPDKYEIQRIGIPVKSVNWVRTHFGYAKNKEVALYITMGQQGDNFMLLVVNPKTGDCRQYNAPGQNSNYPTATLMSRSGILYIGAAYSGKLYAFDPQKEYLEDLGLINPENATFPCAMDEDPQGRVWIGSYGTADLTCFDPARKEFIRYGRMDDIDMYNYPLVNEEGFICNRIAQTKPKCIVLDPRTGQKMVVGPIADKSKDSFELRKDAKGQVYIISNLGKFRIQGFKAIPVKEIPPPAPLKTLGGIKQVSFVGDINEPYSKIEIKMEDNRVNTFKLNYCLAGTDVFYLHKGPDNLIYGSSVLPLHLFRYNPITKELVDLGRASSANGEAYSMANLDGKIYISSYPGAVISVYDPNLPYRFEMTENGNPRDLGRIDDISYRPRSTLSGPENKIWVASLPDYGLWGGPLSYYDPGTGKKKAYYRIAGEASCYTLAFISKLDLIAVGTSVQGGTGTRPKVSQASLFLWDYHSEQKIWEGSLERSVEAFNSLLMLPNGKLIGTIVGEPKPQLFIFSPETRVFEKILDLPPGRPLDLGITLGPDGKVYGFTDSCLYRLDPEKWNIFELIENEKAFDVAGPIVGQYIYFAKGPELKAVKLFEKNLKN